MNSVFISYSGSRVDRALLFNALRDHGMNPWRDVDSLHVGDATTDTIEAELARCSTALLWINRAILDSDYVAMVELPAIVKAYRRGLRIVPVFDGLTPSEAADLISAHGVEIGDTTGTSSTRLLTRKRRLPRSQLGLFARTPHTRVPQAVNR